MEKFSYIYIYKKKKKKKHRKNLDPSFMQPCHNSELTSRGEKKNCEFMQQKNLITKTNSQFLL